ncbi:TPA: hypothetical protein DCX15_00390 [bacterium]|nr:hypothetical protein [bacterium]
MKRWLIIVLILVILLGVAISILVKGRTEEVVLVTKGEVVSGELILKVTSRGKIEAKDRFELSTKIPGVVTYILEEGSIVKKGQVVVALDDKELWARQKEQEALLASYQSELQALYRKARAKELENRVAEARVSFDEAERQLSIAERLFEEKAIPEDRFRQIKVEFERAKIALDLALFQLEEEKNQHRERIEAVNAKISSIQANLASISQQAAWIKLSSPVDGVVIHKQVEKDTYVQPGQMLSVVADTNRFIAKTNLDEVDIAKVALDMDVSVLPDAFPGRAISGSITKTAPSPILREKINTFEVTVALEKTDLPLRCGMLGDLIIVSAKRDNVLKVPYEATVNILDKTYVFVIKRKRAIKREVILGLRNPNEAEVLSGLKEGDEVVINPPVDLKDGAKIRIKREE